MALLSAFFEAQLAALYPSRRIEMCGTAGKIGRLLGALLVAGAVVPTQPEANHISQPRMGNVRVEAPPDGRGSFNTNDTITVIFTAYDAGGAAHTVQSFRGSLTNPLYSDGRGTSVPIRIGSNRPYRELFLRPLQPR